MDGPYSFSLFSIAQWVLGPHLHFLLLSLTFFSPSPSPSPIYITLHLVSFISFPKHLFLSFSCSSSSFLSGYLLQTETLIEPGTLLPLHKCSTKNMEKGQIFNNPFISITIPLMGLSCFTTTTATTTLPSSDQKGQNRNKTSYFHEIKTPLIHRIKN